jgi:hypothetical protein
MLNAYEIKREKIALRAILAAAVILLVGAVTGGLLTKSAWLLYLAICCWSVITVATTVFAAQIVSFFGGGQFGRLKSLVIKLFAITLTSCVCWIGLYLLLFVAYVLAWSSALNGSDSSWIVDLLQLLFGLLNVLLCLTLVVFPFLLPFWFFNKATTSRGWLVTILFACGVLSLTLTNWSFDLAEVVDVLVDDVLSLTLTTWSFDRVFG